MVAQTVVASSHHRPRPARLSGLTSGPMGHPRAGERLHQAWRRCPCPFLSQPWPQQIASENYGVLRATSDLGERPGPPKSTCFSHRYSHFLIHREPFGGHQLRQLSDLLGRRRPGGTQRTPGCSGAGGHLLPSQTGLTAPGGPVSHPSAAGSGGPGRGHSAPHQLPGRPEGIRHLAHSRWVPLSRTLPPFPEDAL